MRNREVISIFIKGNEPTVSEQKIVDYVSKYKLDYEIIPIVNIDRDDVLEIFSCWYDSLSNLFYSTFRYHQISKDLTTDELIQRILKRPKVIRTPLSISPEKKLILGHHEDDLSTLLPKALRRELRKQAVLGTALHFSEKELAELQPLDDDSEDDSDSVAIMCDEHTLDNLAELSE